MKIKIAIADTNETYARRLFEALQRQENLSLSVFTDKKRMESDLSSTRYDIILFDYSMYSGDGIFKNAKLSVLLYDEEAEQPYIGTGKYKVVKKYQRGSSIYKEVIGLYSEFVSDSVFFGRSGEQCRVLCVYSPVGGVGKTTVSMAIANTIANMGRNVMYLNFEPIPAYGSFMPLKGEKGMGALLAAIDGNGSFSLKLESLMKKTPQGIIYFEKFENLLDIYELTAEDVEKLIRMISETVKADFIIVDMGTQYDAVNRSIMDISDKRTVSGYLIDDDYDSYYDDFQTVLLLDDKKPLTAATIYPTFDTSYKANVYAADGKGGNTLQKSGESAVSFVSGKSIQYSVSAEDKEHTKNYWVTFITKQSGPKLFVNGTNNPSDMSENGRPLRKLFLNAYNGNYHDIAFANIGDSELTGITVSLSEDTVGVKLDPYWNVIGTSKKSLAPFTTTSSSKIDNIAKVRLIPEDENTFSAISGTLTISADNGESVSIDLTGYAGLPQITTDKLYTGVKYVPYSSMIMTNSMLSSDAIEFSISKGKLPAGINLMPNGELYGIPHQVGEFKFTVTAKYVGSVDIGIENYSTSHEYTLIVNDNDDIYVDAVNTDEQGYELTDRVSSYITVYYSDTMGDYPVVDRVVFGDSEGASDAEDVAPAAYYEDNIFRSIGLYSEEFIAFYLDGTKLEEGTDYYAEDGSTVITVLDQAFGNAGLSSADEPHTLAAEFRKDGKKGELRRSAQNVYINFVQSSGSKDPEDKPEEKPGETPEEKPEETPEEKPEEKPVNKPSTGTGSSAGSSSGTTNVTVTPLKTVTAFFSVTDENGKAIPDLSIELHSSPKYGTTDGSGSVKFNSVEFGRHTIYINDPASGKKVSKKFSLVAGEEMNVTSDVITAKAGETIWVELRFDGKNISLLSAGVNDIAPSAGAFEESEAVSGGFIGLLCSKGMILFILSAAVVICIISKKAKRN